MKRNREWFMLGLATIAVLGVCIFFAFQMITERRLAASRANVKTPASMAFYKELVTPVSNNGDGGKQIKSVTEDSVHDRQYIEETMARYKDLFDWVINLDYTESWHDVELNILNKQPWEWSADERAQVEEYVSAMREKVLEIRAVAERGGPAYPLDLTKGFEVQLPHLARMRQFARMLRADAIVNAMNGNPTEAVKDIIAGLKLSNALSDEPIFISQLVLIAMQGIMYDAVQVSFDWGEIPQDLARELASQVSQIDNRNAFADSLLGEQFSGLDLFSRLQENGWLSNYDLMDGMDVSGNSDYWPGRFLYSSPLARPWQYMDEKNYTEVMGDMADANRLPYYEAKPILDELNYDIQNLPRTRMLSRFLLPALTRATLAQARNETYLDLMQVGITLEQYYVEHGEYPSELETIAPNLGGMLPLDPHTGEAYHYTPSGNSFLLYSVGFNLSDDGGHQVYRDDGSWNQGEGDIVWRGEKKKSIKVAQK